jgi:hypothetical protein
MGYWGTLVVARPHKLLVDQDGIAGFGHEHRWLRELGDGWQMLELTGFDDPPDLLDPCQAVVASTGHPVLALYVSDSYCAAMCAATADRLGRLTHLWDVSGPCGVFRHQPYDLPAPVGRSLDEIVVELGLWSRSAGLRADEGKLRALLARNDDNVHTEADDAAFALVKALGVLRIGPTLPWSLPAYDWPFSAFMAGYGPASWARAWALARARGEEVPEQPWEAAAVALEAELWESLYRPAVDPVPLARRAAHLTAAWMAAGKSDSMSAAPVSVDDADEERLTQLESRMASGVPPRWSREFDARRWADARATEPETTANSAQKRNARTDSATS